MMFYDLEAAVCWSARLSISWIACNLSSMPLLGCCATGENTTMLHRSSGRDVLHWLPVPLRVEFKICLLVYKSLHGAAPVGICATIVRRRIRPLRGYDFDRRINAIFL